MQGLELFLLSSSPPAFGRPPWIKLLVLRRLWVIYRGRRQGGRFFYGAEEPVA
jgi:hypothetical protein